MVAGPRCARCPARRTPGRPRPWARRRPQRRSRPPPVGPPNRRTGRVLRAGTIAGGNVTPAPKISRASSAPVPIPEASAPDRGEARGTIAPFAGAAAPVNRPSACPTPSSVGQVAPVEGVRGPLVVENRPRWSGLRPGRPPGSRRWRRGPGRWRSPAPWCSGSAPPRRARRRRRRPPRR